MKKQFVSPTLQPESRLIDITLGGTVTSVPAGAD